MTTPALSVIVTCYNIEPYVAQCLDSVLGQTFRDMEIIVVDDGSTDATPAIIDEYARRDGRVVPVLMPENTPGGVATAANLGLDRARGRWVGFVDGDDFVEPSMFGALVGAAERDDTDLAICQYVELDEQTDQLREPSDAHRWERIAAGPQRLDHTSRRTFLPLIAVPWRKLYRRELLEREPIRFPVGDYFFEDNPFHWFALVSATSISVVPEVLCVHRVARSGQTMSTADRRLFRIFQHHDTIAAWLAEQGELDRYADVLVSWVVSQLEWIAERTPDALRRELFDTVAPILGRYDTDTLDRALTFGQKGVNGQALARAVHHGNFASFTRRLDRGGGSGPVTAAVYHLRHSGLTETARLTRRFLGRKVSTPTLRPRRNDRAVTNEDLMLSMLLLERRIDDLAARVEQLRDASGGTGDPEPTGDR